MIVEGHARGDDVDERKAAVPEPRLEDRHQLRLVAGEAAGHEAWRRATAPSSTGSIGGCWLGSPFFDFEPMSADAENCPLVRPYTPLFSRTYSMLHVAANRVAQLAEADRQRVAVAGDADVVQLAVGGVGAGGERRHAPVHAVEAVRLAEEVRGGLGRAADAAHLRHAVRRDVELPEGLDQRRGDRVVPAPGAERGHRRLRSRAA